MMIPDLRLQLTLLLTFTLAVNTYSADKNIPVYGEIKEDRPKKADDGSEQTLKKLLTIKGVDNQYKSCLSAFPNSLKEIPGCIWNGNDEKTIPPLADDLRKQVQLVYSQEASSSGQNRSPASKDDSDKLHLTNKSKQISEDYMSDPAVIELSKVLQKKLESALIGDEAFQKDKKTIAAVDHAKFIEIYRTELGKTIISAFTSYCVEADFDQSLKLTTKNCIEKENQESCAVTVLSSEKEKDTNINKNIKSLKTADLNSEIDNKTNPDASKWKTCIVSVGNICYTKTVDFRNIEDKSNIEENDKNKDLIAQINRSKEKACLIMDYVKSARKNLIIVDKQSKFYEELGPGTSVFVGNAKNVVITEKNSMDTITSVTSKDIEDSYQKKNDDLKKEMDKCIDESGKKILDPEVCKKFISTNTEEKEKAFAEFGIRQYAHQSEIENKLNDKKEVEKYLEEEGYEKKKISQLLESDPNLKIVEEIKERYKNERDAIIASMANKISGQTTKEKGKIDNNDVEKLSAIKSELLSRSDDLKQLVHFNNIVSSYLEIELSNGKKRRNVASLFAEVNNGAKTFRNIDKDQISEIKKKAAAASLSPEKGESPVQLGVDDLNGLFRYSGEESNDK
jgi:hypothetical protein